MTYKEVLPVALAYGWIDGQVKRIDDDWYRQRWTPRRARSVWSKINRAAAEAHDRARGDEAGRACAEVERAKADGRWERAYDSPKTADGAGRPARRARRRPGRREVLRRARRQSTATRSCTASRTPSARRRGPGGSSSSWRCAAAARRFTRAATRGSGASSCARRTRPSSTSGVSRCGCGRGRATLQLSQRFSRPSRSERSRSTAATAIGHSGRSGWRPDHTHSPSSIVPARDRLGVPQRSSARRAACRRRPVVNTS